MTEELSRTSALASRHIALGLGLGRSDDVRTDPLADREGHRRAAGRKFRSVHSTWCGAERACPPWHPAPGVRHPRLWPDASRTRQRACKEIGRHACHAASEVSAVVCWDPPVWRGEMMLKGPFSAWKFAVAWLPWALSRQCPRSREGQVCPALPSQFTCGAARCTKDLCSGLHRGIGIAPEVGYGPSMAAHAIRIGSPHWAR